MTTLSAAATRSKALPWRATGAEVIHPARLTHPDSWAGHIPFAFWLTVAARPRRYVELGVHTGNSYCAVAQAVAAYELATDCFGVDHWFGDVQAGHYGEEVYADLKAWHDPRYGHFSRLLRMSFEDARSHVADESVDILHIDGLHTYEAVRGDFETWRSKMSDRCLVLFHDTNVFQEDFGVWRYWREIQGQFPTFEFLHSNGIGIAYTGTRLLQELSPDVAALFAADQDEVAAIRTYFARLGEGLPQSIQLDDTRRRGEGVVRQLQDAHRSLAVLEQHRAGLDEERDRLQPHAEKWGQLAVRTGGAIGLDLEKISAALARLYNSDNPQARRDRGILKRQFAALIKSGTFSAPSRDLFLSLVSRASRKLRGGASVGVADSGIGLIRASGLFDETFYALTEDARAQGVDPLEHYLTTGEARRMAPSSRFDPDYYARRHPDVAHSGFGLLRHFVLFGQAEGREGRAPAQRMALSVPAEGERPRILLIVHEASRTGAPIVAWNIAAALRDTHDVIAFLKQGGPLREHFAAVCASVIEMPHEAGLHAIDRDAIMVRVAQEVCPAFAIANSAETREFVRALAGAGVGVVHLIHEFSASVRPYGGVYDFLPWAHRLVFPARLVADSFEEEHSYLSRRRLDILPQGAGILPNLGKPFGSAGQADLVRKRLRPVTHEKDFLVVGLGSVIPRKGVDLFVALAALAGAASPSGRALRFVWIGNGFEPRTGSEFASLLGDQIARSGVAGHCEILGELDDLDAVFTEANLMVLPSRLDPMPNTMIDAMSAGVPLLCFDHASGIAELLKADLATAHLVAPYLDVPALGAMVHRFADDESALADASDAVEALARRTFAMDRYRTDLLRLGAEAAAAAAAIARDYDTIAAAAPAFCPMIFNGTWPADDRPHDPLHTYLLRGRVASSDWSTMPVGLRRPLAGFNPLIYAEDCLGLDRSRDPLAHWLDAGRPTGRWSHRLISLEDAKPEAAPLKALLHGHFFYADLIADFLERVRANASTIDVILTVPGDAQAEIARQAVERAPLQGNVEIQVVGNRGRDIGPFLTGLKHEVFSGYDVVGHVHGKRSPHVEAVSGERWRTFLFEHLLGAKVAAADACLKAFAADPALGLVFPEDPNLHGWDANRDLASTLARRMGCLAPLPAAFEWPIGTMFWARPAALNPLFDLDLAWTNYPQEPLPGDGTLLHALERLIPFAVEQAQFGYAASHLLEIQR